MTPGCTTQNLLFHRVGVHLSAAKPSDRDAKEKLEQNALDVESMYLDYVLARQKLTLRFAENSRHRVMEQV